MSHHLDERLRYVVSLRAIGFTYRKEVFSPADEKLCRSTCFTDHVRHSYPCRVLHDTVVRLFDLYLQERGQLIGSRL